ncbi:MAG: glycosyltransferase family 2 protein, partial [Tepidisphaeraceae bacterium]
MDATVVITTKDRKDELRRAVASAVAQVGAAVEVLVIDDGSTDGSSDMLRAEFSTVRVERYERSLGLIVRRNHAAALATAPVILSIDDDAVLVSTHTVAQTLTEFDHPRVGAVAVPFVDIKQGPQVRQRAPDFARVYVASSFIGTAHALRRDLFLKLGGYREQLFHQGEEADYCLRMLDAGCVVRLGSADPIHHFESPRRDFRRMDVYGRRNDVLYAWHNVPLPYLPGHLLATTFNGLCWG